MIYYLFFCLVTTVNLLIKNLIIYFQTKPEISLVGVIVYYLIFGTIIFILAPLFFVIDIGMPGVYEEAVKKVFKGETT